MNDQSQLQPPRENRVVWLLIFQLTLVVTALALFGVLLSRFGALAAQAGATLFGVGLSAIFIRALFRVRIERGNFAPSNLFWAVLGGVGLSVFGNGAIQLQRLLIPAFEPIFVAKEEMMLELLLPDQPQLLPAVVLVLAILPGLCEEFLFRGVFRDFLGGFSMRRRVFILGVLFSAFHLDPTVLLPMMYIGVVFSICAERSGGWWIPAAAHVALNGFSVLVVSRTEALIPVSVFDSVAFMAAGVALATFAVGRIGKLPEVSGAEAPPVELGGAEQSSNVAD